MCGLGGFVNVPDYTARLALVKALGKGIDARGGDAIGYVAVPRTGSPSVSYARVAGEWEHASRRFVASAAKPDGATILHARYATCGDGHSPTQAHPFAVKRDGRTVLWGAHNGVIRGAEASARVHGRQFDVDSRELYELLADGQYAKIRELAGWGVLTWIESAHRDRVNVVCMTDGGALYIVETTCGAIVWGSTKVIVADALLAAGMVEKHHWRQRDASKGEETAGFDVGQVMHIHTDGRLTYAGGEEITLQAYSKSEYRADRRATSWAAPDDYEDYADYFTRDEWDRFAATLAGDDDPADAFGDPGVCPGCRSADTYTYNEKGHCADCGTMWSLATAPANDATTDATEASDNWSTSEWLDYLDRQREADRAARARRTAQALVRVAGKGHT